MSINANFSAHRNSKLNPPILYVHGSILVYTANPQISIGKANPQGINPTILILKLSVQESDSPRKGTSKSVFFEIEGNEIKSYEKVQIIVNDNITYTCDITDSSYGNLIGMQLRTYAEGSVITKDYIKDRVNIVTDNGGIIVNIWFG